MRRLIVLVAVLLVAAAPVRAAGLSYTLLGSDRQSPVEQESPDFFFNENNTYYCTHNADGTLHPDTCVHNPTPCIWDVDDYSSDIGSGDVPASSSITDTKCIIADGFNNYGGDDKHIQFYVSAKTASLTVTVSDSVGGLWIAVPVAGSRGTYTYVICTREHYPGPYPMVPDSNGGTGQRIDYTATITTGTHAANNITAEFQVYGIVGLLSIPC